MLEKLLRFLHRVTSDSTIPNYGGRSLPPGQLRIVAKVPFAKEQDEGVILIVIAVQERLLLVQVNLCKLLLKV